jgi:hypothetical protein
MKPELNMDVVKDNSNDYAPKLSPTPRKSERDRKNISYDKLNKGAVDSEEESPENGGVKKLKLDAKKGNLAEIQNKIKELFEKLKAHEHSHLFNQPLDTNHSLYHEVKDKFTTLSMLDLYFKIGDKYKTTDEIAQEIRGMIMTKFKMSMNGGDATEFPKI